MTPLQKLYYIILVMKDFLRTNIYNNTINLVEDAEIREYLSIEIEYLDEIEILFFAENINKTINKYNNITFNNLIAKKRNRNKLITNNANNIKKLSPTEKIANKIETEFSDNKYNDNLARAFNHYLRALMLTDDRIFKPKQIKKQYPKNGRPQIFLSHAYDDKLYAYALFIYLYKKGLYLYVDWMHNKMTSDGAKLKKNLSLELNNSDQLLYLLTPNSELNISGKHYIRPWCSWETGHFYNKTKSNKKTEKYYISLYSINPEKIQQVHGMNKVTGINKGLGLYGV